MLPNPSLSFMLPNPINYRRCFDEKSERKYHIIAEKTDSRLAKLREDRAVDEFSIGNDSLSPHSKSLYFYGSEGIIICSFSYHYSTITREFRGGRVEIKCRPSQKNNSLATSLEKIAQDLGFERIPADSR